jgi:hypothetical protein
VLKLRAIFDAIFGLATAPPKELKRVRTGLRVREKRVGEKRVGERGRG